MYFPWHKYEEKSLGRRNTLQIFITNHCNLYCEGCFARNIMKNRADIGIKEYSEIIKKFIAKDGQQINILGGEPLLHSKLGKLLDINLKNNLKTTVYTNGYYLNRFKAEDFKNIKLRISLYCKTGGTKSVDNLPKTKIPIEVCYMVSKNTNIEELLGTAKLVEKKHNCSVFFISSIRELDNPNKEFFDDTAITMNLFDYKKLIHGFLQKYDGQMEIHISKRGVFESTMTLADNRCRFANYFIGGKIIQCPYDVVNLKFQEDYSFNSHYCRQNNACLMSKIILKRR